jgi:hypothetical protein
MSGFHAPPIALPHPLMRDPMPPGVWRRPVTGHPLVAVADPAPIAIQPYIAGHGGNADEFLPRWRGCHHHDAASVMPLIRNDDTSGEGKGDQKTGKQTEQVRRHIGNRIFEIETLLKRTYPRAVDCFEGGGSSIVRIAPKC